MTKTWLTTLGAALMVLPYPAAAQTRDWSIPVTYELVWDEPGHGWQELVAHSKTDAASRSRVGRFLGLKLRDAWSASSPGDGYKTLRDLIAELSKSGETMGEDKAASDQLIYDAAYNLDRYVRDMVPDNLYAFLKTP